MKQFGIRNYDTNMTLKVSADTFARAYQKAKERM